MVTWYKEDPVPYSRPLHQRVWEQSQGIQKPLKFMGRGEGAHDLWLMIFKIIFKNQLHFRMNHMFSQY